MTIHLPGDVERTLEALVQSGRYPTIDEAMTNAARLLLSQLERERPTSPEPESAGAMGRKPIWEKAAELRSAIPAEEWEKLPVDGASQHDHSISGTPKRPTP